MALQDVFLLPLGLLGLLALIPVILLYFLQPDPRRVRLPTLRFLYDDQGEEGANPLLERLKRSLLLLLQLLILIALATSIAAPYVAVPETGSAGETVLVIDASASMATRTDGGTRFDVFADDVSERARKSGVDHELVATDEAFFDAFSRVWIE